jgi:hypothetical protein
MENKKHNGNYTGTNNMNVKNQDMAFVNDTLENAKNTTPVNIMKKAKDKNLQNVDKDLSKSPVNSHQAQQIQQDTNDRRHQDALNHDE